MILAPNGKPVSSKRRVGIQISLVDQQAMVSQPKTHTLGFVLDRPDRIEVAQFLATVSRSIVAKLDEIGFFQPAVPQADGDPG